MRRIPHEWYSRTLTGTRESWLRNQAETYCATGRYLFVGVRPRWTLPLMAAIVALALSLPAMAYSPLVVLDLKRLVRPRIPHVGRWLGLSAA